MIRDKAIDEIGEYRIVAAEDLVGWLKDPENVELNAEFEHFRHAGSLVCRSEAAILGISSPRFCVRVHSDSFGFLSFRRLELLKQEYASSLNLDINFSLGDLVDSRSMDMIADSVLRVPERLKPAYQIIGVEIASDFDEEEFIGSPFMQSFALGGGLCAQAAIWMGASYLREDITQLDGPGGISMLTASPSPPGELQAIGITGMDFQEVGKYLRMIGSRECVHGIFVDKSENISGELTGEAEADDLRHLLSSYTLSGFASILAVDLGRLAGTTESQGLRHNSNSIYKLNKVPEQYRVGYVGQYQDHAVVCVGFSADEDSFLIHDPASLPFLRISANDLLASRTYSDKRDNSENPVEYLVDRQLGTSFNFQPVIPQAVSLMLTNWSRNSVHFSGLETLYGELISREESFTLAEGVSWASFPAFSETEFRLIKCIDVNGSYRRRFALDGFLSGSEEATELDEVMRQIACQYAWVQKVELDAEEKIFLVWAASEVKSSVYPYGEPIDYLAGYVRHVGNNIESSTLPKWSTKNVRASVSQTREVLSAGITLNTEIKIAPRLLTSAFTDELPVTFDKLSRVRDSLIREEVISEDDVLSVEFYAAMHNQSQSNAVRFFANGGFGVPASSSPFAEWCLQISKEFEKRKLRIDGIASFIPEIASGYQPAHELGKNALFGLFEFSRLLKMGGFHAPSYLEVVGGTVRDSLSKQPETERALGAIAFDVVMLVDDRNNKFQQVLSAISSSVEKYRDAHSADLPFKIAAEMEVGPYFNFDSIARLGDFIDFAGEQGQEICLNADLSHLELGGAEEYETLLSRRDLLSKVVNFHVSGSGICHTSDLKFERLNPRQKNVIRNVATANPSLVRNGSLAVSVEYEAARDIDLVIQSMKNLSLSSV
jgi:hypothetical protein